jgi:archaellum component FlaC
MQTDSLMAEETNTTPLNTQSPAGSPQATDNWVMQAINNVREDMKEQSLRTDATLEKISNGVETLDTRVRSIETKITRLVWTIGTVGVILTLLWGGYEFVTGFVDIDISVTPKT